jgi:hypothetical protein
VGALITEMSTLRRAQWKVKVGGDGWVWVMCDNKGDARTDAIIVGCRHGKKRKHNTVSYGERQRGMEEASIDRYKPNKSRQMRTRGRGRG